MPSAYLLKTEPSEYSFADLQRDKQTLWDGISNSAAVKNLREMQPGAPLIIYESGEVEKRGGHRDSPIRECFRSQESPREDRGGKTYRTSSFAGGNQNQQAVRRLAPGAPRKAERRAVNERAISSARKQLRAVSHRNPRRL